MQRSGFANPPPAHSPPLHHPVPQHVSTVPQLRSPPPPAPQPQAHSSYGYPSQQPGAQGGPYSHPAFGGFINDTTAQMGLQVGKNLVMSGQDYMGQNLHRYVSVPALKHYFNVSNFYVVNKLYLVLFPWRHKPWSRIPSGQEGVFLPPREDINSPDMYIPTMSIVTYILLSTLLAGLRGAFHPELLGSTAVTALVVVILEIACLKLGMYLLSISNESQLLDLLAYAGYKFVGVIVTTVLAEVMNRGAGTGGWTGWIVFIYTYMALAFFLLRSLRYVLLPDNSTTGAGGTIVRAQRNRRTQFLFIYAYVVQLVFMWLLTRQDSVVLKTT